MRGPKRRPLRFLWESAQVKTLIILFFTMAAACLSSYLITFFNMHGQVYQLSSEIIQNRAEYFLEMLNHSDLSLEEMIGCYKAGIGSIELYDRFQDLPPMQGIMVESDMRDETVYFSAIPDLPLGVMRIQGHYLVIPPFLYDWEPQAVKRLVIHTLLICASIASICTMVAIHRAYRPLRKINSAIAQVGRGDFSVQVDVKSKDEIGKIARNFNWMTRELGRIEYLRRDFVSSVSHEFKTPLAAVQGSARFLASLPQEKLTGEKLKKYTSVILEETNRMTLLCSNLLRLTRLEHQSAAENISSFSLDEQLRQTLLSLENQWDAKKLQLDVHLDETVICQGDNELLFQVWTNLLTNAIKFSNPGGILYLALETEGSKACVEIGDNGCGMNEETMHRLFEKFYQGDTSHQTEGSGLGLSIVKRIIDLHHGEISYQSALEKGTLCMVRIPLRHPGSQETCS